MLSFLIEKPPVDKLEKVMQKASKTFIFSLVNIKQWKKVFKSLT